jgi:hypothetical protein
VHAGAASAARRRGRGLGFVDPQFGAKPALAQWDALYARPRA